MPFVQSFEWFETVLLVSAGSRSGEKFEVGALGLKLSVVHCTGIKNVKACQK